MPCLQGYSCGEVLLWRRGASADPIIQFTPRGGDLTTQLPAKQLAFELAEVDSGDVAWTDVCSPHVLAAGNKEIEQIIRKVFGPPSMTGAGAKRRRGSNAVQPDDDVEAPLRASNNNRPLAVRVRPPPRVSSDQQRIVERAPHEHPIEGITIRIVPNKKLQLTRQRITEVEHGKSSHIRFGICGGGPSSAELEVGSVARRKEFADSDDDDEAPWSGRSTRRFVRSGVSEVVSRRFQGSSPQIKRGIDGWTVVILIPRCVRNQTRSLPSVCHMLGRSLACLQIAIMKLMYV